MPNYKGHIGGGIVSFALLATLIPVAACTSWLTFLEWFMCALLGSLFPDIDTKSKGQKIFYQLLGIAMLILLWLQKFKLVAFLGLISVMPLVVRHRGLFHTWWFLLGLCIGFIGLVNYYVPGSWYLFKYDALFFLAGMSSHLLLDFCFSGAKRKRFVVR